MSLDKLRALDEAASPGPLSTEKREPGHVCVRAPETGIMFCAIQRDPEDFGLNEANAERAALSHLLLPAMEALKKWGDSAYECRAATCKCKSKIHLRRLDAEMFEESRAVLARLEEALR